MYLNKIISMVFLLLSLGEVSSYAAQDPGSAMDERADGPGAASVSHAPLPHLDHLLFKEICFGKWLALDTQDILEVRGLNEIGYDGFAAEMQGGGNLAQYENLQPHGDFFGGMVRRPQGLVGNCGLEDSLLGLLNSVPENHSVQILGYPLLWKNRGDHAMSYVVIHRESTERDTEISLETMKEVFHRDQITSFIRALRGIRQPVGDPSNLIDQLNRFGKISLADCLSTLLSINRPGFPRGFVVEQLYKEGATSPAAQMRLGAFYSQQNKKGLARQCYKQAADQGHVESQCNFAAMCFKGEGGEVNFPMARTYYQRAADQGVANAQASFAIMCMQSLGGEVDFPRASAYFKRAADQGIAMGQAGFATLCFKGLGGEVNFPAAREYHKRAADQGHKGSQVKFAEMCERGQGGEIDLPMARQYFQLAAQRGDAVARIRFSAMCYQGQGGDINLPAARDYFQLAADQGHARAQHNFARMCFKSEGGERDLPMARQYYKLAADQGYADSQNDFALMCERGQGGKIDLLMAVDYFTRAADQDRALSRARIEEENERKRKRDDSSSAQEDESTHHKKQKK
jgi:TPR repeat protein